MGTNGRIQPYPRRSSGFFTRYHRYHIKVDRRTIFVGNLPIKLALKRVSQISFSIHFFYQNKKKLTCYTVAFIKTTIEGYPHLCPHHKIESVRFCSIPSKHLHLNYQLLTSKAKVTILLTNPSSNHKHRGRTRKQGLMIANVHPSGVQKTINQDDVVVKTR